MKNEERVRVRLMQRRPLVPPENYSSAPAPARRLASCAPRHPLAPAQRRVMSFSPFIMLPTLFGVLGHIGFCFLLLDKWESLELVSG